MKRLVTALFLFTFALFLTSCGSTDHNYELQIDDSAQLFSNRDLAKLRAVEISEGYHIAIVTVDQVTDNNLYKHAREGYSQISDNTKSGDETIVIFCFKNEGVITTKMAPSLQNIIDTEHTQRYYQCQKVEKVGDFGKQTAEILDMVINATAQHKDFSFFKKNAISDSVMYAFDFVLRYTIPQDSWIYKVVFHIPMQITLYITKIIGSISYWVIVILIILLWLFRELFFRKNYLKNSTSAKTLLSSFIYLIFKILIILIILCMYTISVPRQELVVAMQQYGISEALIAGLQSNLADVTLTSFGWLGCTLICIFLLICKIVSEPEYIVYSLFKPAYQKRIYEQNKKNIKTQIMTEKTAKAVSGEYDDSSIDVNKLDNDDRPYTTLASEHVSKSLFALLYIIPICIFFNSSMLLFYALYKSISLLQNLPEIIREIVAGQKHGLLG